MNALIPLVFSFKKRGKSYDEIQKWFNISDDLMPDVIGIVNKKIKNFDSIGSDVYNLKRGKTYGNKRCVLDSK